MRPAYIAFAGGIVGAGLSAVLTLLMVVLGLDTTPALVILGAQVLAAFAVLFLAARSNSPQLPASPQPAPQPPLQPPATARRAVAQPLDDLIIRLPNRPQPPATAAQPGVQPPQPPAQPQPQPQREPVIMPFPLQDGQRHEPRQRVEIPWQPAPWDPPSTSSVGAPSITDAVAEPVEAALLPLRPPTAADYEVIREVLVTNSRRDTCVIVYGYRDGRTTYPWIRKVADYWDISEPGRPSILAWELIGSNELPGRLARDLGIEMTDDQVAAAIDAASLTRCPECDAWCLLDELTDDSACTKCTA